MKKSFLSYSLQLIFVLGAAQASTVFATAHSPAIETIQKEAQAGFEKLAVQIHKSPTDKAIYQAIRLDNGMEVLLISDDKANKSLFSVGLPIGSMEDPKEQQGLAHYLEHMILMGSKDYPETNSLDGFLTKNGGRNNAYTAPDRTVYYLQVNNNAFDEAVARLSDAFAAPLLAETNAKKEVNAVNAEMVRAKSSDGHLIRSVNRATANPAHPYTNFAVGNNETLSDKPNSKLQDELLKFYDTYYSANVMKAVLYANQPIDKLATLAANTLGKVKNKNVSVPTLAMPLFTEQDLGVVLHYNPVIPTKSLTVSFDMPEDKAAFRQKSGEYLSYVFSNNTEGTLADYLVKQGLSDSGIGAIYSDDVSRNRGSFNISVRLTDKGLAEQDKIISLIFQQIEQIKKEGIQASYFGELKESLSQDFKHLRVDKSFNYAASLVSQMLSYPLENIFDQAYVADEMDVNEIKAKLDLMMLDNARIFIVDDKAPTNQKTPYFEAPYAIAKITAAQKSKWLDFSQNPTLKLPALNPYFTTEFTLNEVDTSREIPKLILKGKGTEIYAMPSKYFSDEAKARLRITMSISPRADNVKMDVTSVLLNVMNGLAHRQTAFQASVAGMSANLMTTADSIGIVADGYTQNLAKLLQDVVVNFSQFELTEKDLALAKQRYLENLDALEKDSAQRQAMQPAGNFARYPFFETAKKRQVLAEISLDDVKNLRERLLNKMTAVRILSLGNLSDTQLKILLKSLEKVVKNNNSHIEFGRYVDINQSQRKINYIKHIPHEDNALSVSYFSTGYGDIEGSVRASLLAAIISRWYFDDLRTDKQLGYVVSASRDRIGKTSGISFTVQSPIASTNEIMQHNQRFVTESFERLQKLSDTDFEKYRSNLIETMQHKPESLLREFGEYNGDFMHGNDNFDRKAQAIKLLKVLTKQDIVDFYRQTLVEQNGFVFASQAIGTNTRINQAADLAGFETIESIEALQKEFEIKHYH